MLHFCRGPDKDWLRIKLSQVGDMEPYFNRDGALSYRTPDWVIRFREEKEKARRERSGLRTFAKENLGIIATWIFALAWVLWVEPRNMNVDRWGAICFALLPLLSWHKV